MKTTASEEGQATPKAFDPPHKAHQSNLIIIQHSQSDSSSKIDNDSDSLNCWSPPVVMKMDWEGNIQTPITLTALSQTALQKQCMQEKDLRL